MPQPMSVSLTVQCSCWTTDAFWEDIIAWNWKQIGRWLQKKCYSYRLPCFLILLNNSNTFVDGYVFFILYWAYTTKYLHNNMVKLVAFEILTLVFLLNCGTNLLKTLHSNKLTTYTSRQQSSPQLAHRAATSSLLSTVVMSPGSSYFPWNKYVVLTIFLINNSRI